VVLSEIIVGIISKAGISLLHSGLNYVWSGIKKDQNILRQVELTVNELSNIDPITIDKIEDFLLSQEVDCIIKQIFSAKILKTENEKRIHDIEIEFSKLLILHVNLTNDEYQIISPILFKALVNSCIRIYEEDIEKNHIATSQEKLGNYRFQILLDYIENLDRNLELLKNKEYHTVQEYLEFEQQYRFQMVDRYQTIRPIHFEEAQKITLDSIYVAPNFTHSEDLGNGDRKEISNVDFINRINRCVVLGDPGAGKTTLSKKICYDFARGLSKTQYGISDFTPIYVELRDYGLKLESNGFSIIQYIEYTSNTFLQKAPPEGFFDYILVNGRAFVIFDGLDELLDTSKRQLISDNIDSFCNQYPTTKILVTSRKVGYEQAPLSQNRFNLYYISDFNPEQVKEYVSKWFSQNFDLEIDEKEKKVLVFL
jgi:predicted NACHT family NTPase